MNWYLSPKRHCTFRSNLCTIAEVLGVDFPSHTESSLGNDYFDVGRAESTHSANVAFTRKFADLGPEPKDKALALRASCRFYRYDAQARVHVGRIAWKDRRDQAYH